MNVIKLRITSDGNVTGLWDDQINWRSLGTLDVRRASHVEFCRRKQMWYVRDGRKRNALRKSLRTMLRRPVGKILYWADSRAEALAWEARYFGVGGPGWLD